MIDHGKQIREGWASMIRAGHLTDVGRKRRDNEDSYLVLLPPSTPSGVDAVLAVADGMGGHQAGEVASALAVQTVSDCLGAKGEGFGAGLDSHGYLDLLANSVQQANRLILAEGQDSQQGMGTTLTLGLMEGTNLHVAHVGDSRAYILRGAGLEQLTEDHSWVGEQVRAGLMDSKAAESHPKRNILTRALGSDQCVHVDTATTKLEDADLVLLCSDGLHGVMTDEQISQVLRSRGSPQDLCFRLIQQANRRGGPDNITVVIALVGGQESNTSDAPTMRMSAHGRIVPSWWQRALKGIGFR